MCLPVDFLEDPICVSIISHDLEAHLSDQYLPVQPPSGRRWRQGASQNNTEAHPAGGGSAGAPSPWTPSHCPPSMWPSSLARTQHMLLATQFLGSWAQDKGKPPLTLNQGEAGGSRRQSLAKPRERQLC